MEGPTFSRSLCFPPARMTFCDEVARLYGRFSLPRNTSLNCTIPALVKISVGSLAGTSDDEGTGSVDDLADEDADRLLPDAIEVIREYDRASASLLQRRLKVGYARAARMIDQLEARGYIGAFDGSNARQVLRREDGVGAAELDDGLDGDD